MLRKDSVARLISDIVSRNITIKNSITPYLELGHTNPKEDLNLVEAIQSFKRFFVDYPYSKGNLKNNTSWNVKPSGDLITLIDNLVRTQKSDGVRFSINYDQVVPTISDLGMKQNMDATLDHYENLLSKYKKKGFQNVALKLKLNRRGMTNPANAFKNVITKLGENDFVFIDCSPKNISFESFKKYKESLYSNTSAIKLINKKVKVAYLNPEFYIDGKLKDSGVSRHNFGKELMENDQLFGYGNYLTDPPTDFAGRSMYPFAYTFYNYQNGDFKRFDSGDSFKNTLVLMGMDTNITKLIKEHSKHCSSCEKLESYIENPVFGEKELKKRGRKGQLGKEHYVNSIVIDENIHGTPSPY